MGAANEKEKTQAIAYQRDFLGSCWSSPYGVLEAQTFIPSRWCGISQLFMEHNTGHKCIALQAHRAAVAAKLEEHLDVMNNATVKATTMIAGGDESFGVSGIVNPGSPLRSNATAGAAFPASPTGVQDEAFGPAKLKKLGLPKKGAASDEHLGSTIDLMLLQQRAASTTLGAGGAMAGSSGVGATASMTAAAGASPVIAKPHVIQGQRFPPGASTSLTAHTGEKTNVHERSFSAASVVSDTAVSSAGTIRRVVRDTQVVESALHNRQLYLRAHGLSVHQDVIFRAAPAHRRYDCISLVSACAPEQLRTHTSLRFALPDRHISRANSSAGGGVPLPRTARARSLTGPPSQMHFSHRTPDQIPNAHPQTLGDVVDGNENMRFNKNASAAFSPLVDDGALARSLPPAPHQESPRSRRSQLRRTSSAPGPRQGKSRANNVGYVDFDTNPLHDQYNYHLQDVEAGIPAARLAAAQGRHRHAGAQSDKKKNKKDKKREEKKVGVLPRSSKDAEAARQAEDAIRDYAAGVAPLIIGTISAVELQTLPHNAEVCLGGWLYVSLEDEQKRLRRVLDRYEAFLIEKQVAEAERERAAAAAASEFSTGGGRSPPRRSKRPSLRPSPSLSPQRTPCALVGRSLGGRRTGAVDTGLLPPSALAVSKTTGTFTQGASGAVQTTEAIPSELSTPKPRNRRARSLDGDVSATHSVPPSPFPAGMSGAGLGPFRRPSLLNDLGSGPGQRFMDSHRLVDDPLAPEDFWMPHVYMIIAMPMYECSICPTVFHAMNNRTKPVSLNIVNPLSRETFGVGCITSIRYGGVIVLECREPVTVADKDWLLALKKLGEQCQTFAAESMAKAASAAAVPRDLSLSAAAARRAAEEEKAVEMTRDVSGDGVNADSEVFSTPRLTADVLERSVLKPYDAPLRDADLAWLHRKRLDKVRYLRRALRSKLEADGFNVIFAYTRTARRQRRAATRKAAQEQARANGSHNSTACDAGHRVLAYPLSREHSLVPPSDANEGGEEANDEDDDIEDDAGASQADAQDDQDDVGSDEELEFDWDGVSSHGEVELTGLSSGVGNKRHDDDPFGQHGHTWFARAAQDATSPANYIIKGTFRQIGGVRYFDTTSLLDGCQVREVVDGVVRWARNLRRTPVKARPLSLFLQRYEGITSTLRIAQGSTTRAVLQALYRSGAPANVLLQANASFSHPGRSTQAAAGGVPSDSFAPGTVGSFVISAAASAPPVSPVSGPVRSVFPFITHYTGPLDPIVRAILSPEVEHMIRTAEEGVAAKVSAPAAVSTGVTPSTATAAVSSDALEKTKKRTRAETSTTTSHQPQPASSLIDDHQALAAGGVRTGTVGSAATVSALTSSNADAPKTIEAMLVGTATLPLAGAAMNPSVTPGVGVTNATFTNASITNASFTNTSFGGLRGPPNNNNTFSSASSGQSGHTHVTAASPSLPNDSMPLAPGDAGSPRPNTIHEPIVSNNTFILQSGVCVQRPPERFAAASTPVSGDGLSRIDGPTSIPGMGANAAHSSGSGSDTSDNADVDEEGDEGDGPHRLNRTMRLSQIAVEAVQADGRAGRSQAWLDADAALRQVKAELEEMRFLVANADAELEQRIQEYVTTSSLFLPHTRVDQTALVLLSVKMLRQFPEDVPVKELHSDWLPLLLATLTLPNDHIFVTERSLTVRDHQARQVRANGVDNGAEYVLHDQDNVYGHLMPPEDVCDANKRREAFNDPGASTKYAIEAIRALPPPQPLHDVVIAPIPYRISTKTALALEQQGVDTTYSFCFTGGSVGVLAGVLRVYADSMRERCQREIQRALATGGPEGLLAEAKSSVDLLLKRGYNVFLRRIWVWGSTSKKKPGFIQRLLGNDELDDEWSEVGAGGEDGETHKKKKKKKKQSKKASDDFDRTGSAHLGSFNGATNDSMTSNAEHDKHGNVRRAALPYRLSEGYALFDAIMHYLRTYRDMERDFRAATMSTATLSHASEASAQAHTAAPILKHRSFLQPRRSANAESAAPAADEPVTEELFVTDFEVCVATNYYYKRVMVEQPYRCSSVFDAADKRCTQPPSPCPVPGTSGTKSNKSAAKSRVSGNAQHRARATAAATAAASSAARRLLNKHEEQRRAHKLSTLILRHTERRGAEGESSVVHRSTKQRSGSVAGRDDNARAHQSEREPFRDGREPSTVDAHDKKVKKSTRQWRAIAAEVEVPYCGGEEEEASGAKDNAKGLYDFLENSLQRWRSARQSDLNTHSGTSHGASAPRHEAQDACMTAYERAEMEKMVRSAVKLSLS